MSQRALCQLQALTPDHVGDEIAIEAMIETCEALAEKAHSIINAQGGQI